MAAGSQQGVPNVSFYLSSSFQRKKVVKEKQGRKAPCLQ